MLGLGTGGSGARCSRTSIWGGLGRCKELRLDRIDWDAIYKFEDTIYQV